MSGLMLGCALSLEVGSRTGLTLGWRYSLKLSPTNALMLLVT